jgi:predicted nucleic acid-binding protein
VSRYFWDTNLFIYQIEVHPVWGPKVSALVAYQEAQGILIMTSALTLGEVLVKPTKDSRNDLISAYETLFADIECIPIGQDVARQFASLRADHGVKSPDALQLACATIGRADAFITNDERLSRLSSSHLAIYSLDGFIAQHGLVV